MRALITRSLLAIAVGVALPWLASCEREEPPDLEAFSVTGRIIDSLALAPIDSAVLSLDDTTGGGRMAFSDSVATTHFHQVVLPSRYTFKRKDIGLNRANSGTSTRTNLTLISNW